MQQEIKGLGIKNFRVFRDSELQFYPITIITGTNNSGKSSLIKALILLNKYFATGRLENDLEFDIDDINLGNFESLVNSKDEKFISFSFPIEWSVNLYGTQKNSWNVEYKFAKSPNPNKDGGYLSGIRFFENFSKRSLIDIEFINKEYKVFEVPGIIEKSEFISVHLDVDTIYSLIENEINTIIKKNEIVKDEVFEFNLENKTTISKVNESNGEGYFPMVPPLCAFNKNNLSKLFSEWEKAHAYRLQNNEKLNVDKTSFKLKKTPLLFYNSTLCKEDSVKIEQIERNAIQEYSKRIFKYSSDKDFIKNVSNDDALLYFTINNFDDPHSDSRKFKRVVSRLFNIRETEISESLSFFEHIYYMVLYELSRDAEMKVAVDFKKYFDTFNEIFNNSSRGFYLPIPDIERERFVPFNLRQIEIFFQNLLKEISSIVNNQFPFHYIPSLRSNLNRLLSYKYDHSIFAKTLREFINLDIPSKPEYSFFLYWLKEFNIGTDLLIDNYEGTSKAVFIIKNDRKVNILDLGHGTNQLLPILMKIVDVAVLNGKEIEAMPNMKEYAAATIIIEEPESNLHPKMQSKLADLFIDAMYKFNIKFILETHSEYLIRKIQYWTARKMIKPEVTGIYYFSDPEDTTAEEQIKKITIAEDGSLSNDFGQGFFDEAINLKLDILKLKNTQKN